MFRRSANDRSTSLSRRSLLKGSAFIFFAHAFRPTRWALASETPTASEFLDPSEFQLLDAMTARIVPTDDLPGAREAGAAEYIQTMLSRFPGADANSDARTSAADLTAITLQLDSPSAPNAEADVDDNGRVDATDLGLAPTSIFRHRPVFAGGPFSGRQPHGDSLPVPPLPTRPGNGFLGSAPMSRLQRMAWQVRLDGPAGIPELAANPLAASLAESNLRRRYRDGLARVEVDARQRFGASFLSLHDVQKDQVLAAGDTEFLNLVTAHTVEGMFCPPEYGGNRNRVGWQLIGFDGDSQPLGYTLGFDEGRGQYLERPDKPNSLPDPDDRCEGFPSNIVRFLNVVASNPITAPGGRFTSPFCFDVNADLRP